MVIGLPLIRSVASFSICFMSLPQGACCSVLGTCKLLYKYMMTDDGNPSGS